MSKFISKPTIIEADQWQVHGDHKRVLPLMFENCNWQFCPNCSLSWTVHGWIQTLEGGHIVCPNDWIIKGVKGEYYACKPDIFKLRWELYNNV